MYEKILKIITDSLGVLVIKASGFWGFIVKIIYKALQKQVVEVGEKIDNKVEAKKEAKEELEKYNEAISKPNITKEERRLADKAFIGDD